jgi:hypothetical protein
MFSVRRSFVGQAIRPSGSCARVAGARGRLIKLETAKALRLAVAAGASWRSCVFRYSRNAVRIPTNLSTVWRTKMQRFILLALAVLFAFVFLHSRAFAQAQRPSTAFEQKTYVYEPWIKGKFSEVVTVKNPGKWIFLAGIGPESEGDGKLLFPGDFYRQCK